MEVEVLHCPLFWVVYEGEKNPVVGSRVKASVPMRMVFSSRHGGGFGSPSEECVAANGRKGNVWTSQSLRRLTPTVRANVWREMSATSLVHRKQWRGDTTPLFRCGTRSTTPVDVRVRVGGSDVGRTPTVKCPDRTTVARKQQQQLKYYWRQIFKTSEGPSLCRMALFYLKRWGGGETNGTFETYWLKDQRYIYVTLGSATWCVSAVILIALLFCFGFLSTNFSVS